VPIILSSPLFSRQILRAAFVCNVFFVGPLNECPFKTFFVVFFRKKKQ
jgi:hypothetical protein